MNPASESGYSFMKPASESGYSPCIRISFMNPASESGYSLMKPALWSWLQLQDCLSFIIPHFHFRLLKLASTQLNYLIGIGAILLYINIILYVIPMHRQSPCHHHPLQHHTVADGHWLLPLLWHHLDKDGQSLPHLHKPFTNEKGISDHSRTHCYVSVHHTGLSLSSHPLKRWWDKTMAPRTMECKFNHKNN